MRGMDYTYIFKPIGEKNTNVSITNHRTKEKTELQIGVKDYTILVNGKKRTPPIAADIIDIAIAVHLADRLSMRQKDMPCRIELILPVRHPDLFNQEAIIAKLQDILEWYTEDHWFFQFKYYTQPGRPSELQLHIEEVGILQTQETGHAPEKVALWSGGLDALAGLYQQLHTPTNEHFFLFGAGSNVIVHQLQETISKRIAAKFPNRVTLIRTPTLLKGTKRHAKSSELRARGFVFILQGIACAYSIGRNDLYLYENGVGAINLPFTKSEVGLDHSRSVHPLSLRHLEAFAMLIFGQSFRISNPFLFSTKAEVCRDICQSSDVDLVFGTVSCDSRHRRTISQCGYCSSCLLRRQALAALHIEDHTKYVITHDSSRAGKPTDRTHFIAMDWQVEEMRKLLSQSDPWLSMTKRYEWLQEIVDRTWQKEASTKDEMIQRLLQMYQRHIQEWDIALPIISAGLL